MVRPVFLCAFFLVTTTTLLYVRPTNIVHVHAEPILCQRPISTSHCGAVHGSLVFLRSNPTPSFNSSQLSCLASNFFLPRDHPGLLQQASSPRLAGRPLSCPPPPVPRVCHSSHLMPRFQVSQMIAPAGPLTCLHVCTLKICVLHAFCCFLLHLPIHTPSAQKSVAMVDTFSSASWLKNPPPPKHGAPLVQWYDVGGQILVIQREQREAGVGWRTTLLRTCWALTWS